MEFENKPISLLNHQDNLSKENLNYFDDLKENSNLNPKLILSVVSGFFLNWKSESQKDNECTKNQLFELVQNLKQITKAYITLCETNNLLLENNKLLLKDVDSLKKSLLSLSVSLEKPPKIKRKKRALRDPLNRLEFETILSLDINGRSALSLARKRLALVLLYITGLRVSNLLVLKVSDLNDILLKKEFHIGLIKRGSESHRILISDSNFQLLEKYKKDISILLQNKAYDDFVFSSLRDPKKAYQRAEFTRSLNAILFKSSCRLQKNLKTHSFRTTLITQLLVNTPLNKVSSLIGHKSIISTLRYDRNILKRKEQRVLIESRLEAHLPTSLEE